eukprot:2331346-Ditylum_brightwellii.AAC.1
MKQLRGTQYRAQQHAADKIQQLQKVMEQEKAKVELELKKKIEEAQQKIDEELSAAADAGDDDATTISFSVLFFIH